MDPLISVVVPNMNGMEHLPDCFAALAAADYPADRQEWILTDNGSTDGSLAFIRQQYPRTRIVENGGNVGFARGCNAGAAAAIGEYVVFLNNDTRVHPAWLRGYLHALARDSQAVCAASYMRSWDDREVDFNGATANLFGVGRQQTVAGWPDCPTGLAEGSPLLFACGGAMLIRRDVFQAVGGFDPTFFIYYEDVDLGWRLWVLGYRVIFAPGSRVYHKAGGTTGATRAPSHRRYLLFETNTLATIIKNYAQANLDRVLPAALLLEWKRGLLAAAEGIDPEHYRLHGTRRDAQIEEQGVARLPPISVAHLLALGHLGARLPHLMAERARIQAARRRPDAEILALFARPFQPQFAGAAYADAMRRIAAALDLYPLVAATAPSRILILSPANGPAHEQAAALRALLAGEFHVRHGAGEPDHWILPPPPGPRPDGEPPPTVADLLAQADLLIAVGSAIRGAEHLAPDVPLAAAVGALAPGAAPSALLTALQRRAGLLLCADPAAWHTVLPETPALAQPSGGPLTPALRQYCRYPLHQG